MKETNENLLSEQEKIFHSILLVLDDIDFINKLKNKLSKKYIVNTASNGYEAIQKLKEIPRPDLIISDVEMPIMDGHIFLEELSNLDNYYLIPFVFIITNPTEDNLIKSRENGVIDYITMPFREVELIAKIESLINREYEL